MDIIEAMARAYCKARGVEPEGPILPGSDVFHAWQMAAIGMEDALRAALEAAGLLEPVSTDEIVRRLHRAAYPKEG